MATIPASENEFPQVLFTEGAAPSTPASGLIVAYAKAGGVYAWKDDGGTEHIVGEGDVAAHLADTTDAHDASAVSFDPTGLAIIAGTEVQTALEELDAAVDGLGGGGGMSILGYVQYVRGSDGAILTSASTTAVDVDATNVQVTFTAPASGIVKVTQQAFGSSDAGNYLRIGIRESTTNVGTPYLVTNNSVAGNRFTIIHILTGVSAGSHTYKMSLQMSSGANGSVLGGPAFGSVIMIVEG